MQALSADVGRECAPGAGEYSFASRVRLAENVYPALILAAIGRHRLR